MEVYVVAYLVKYEDESYFEWQAFTDYHKAQDGKRSVVAMNKNVSRAEVYTIDVFDVVADEIERQTPWVNDVKMKH